MNFLLFTQTNGFVRKKSESQSTYHVFDNKNFNHAAEAIKKGMSLQKAKMKFSDLKSTIHREKK